MAIETIPCGSLKVLKGAVNYSVTWYPGPRREVHWSAMGMDDQGGIRITSGLLDFQRGVPIMGIKKLVEHGLETAIESDNFLPRKPMS